MAKLGTDVVGFTPVAIAAPSIRCRTISFAPGLLRLSVALSNPGPIGLLVTH